MKLKHFALCAVAAAILGCNTDSNNNDNNLGSIALSGTVTSGETLTTSVSDPDGISENITYFWYADGQAIPGATGSSFTLTDDQIGLPITAQALYTDDGGINESHITDPTANVSAISFAASITVTGNAIIGSTLTAMVADGNGVENATVVYKWFADDVEIDGQVLSTLELAEEQVGTVITVNATFEDDRGFEESVTSLGTQPVTRVNSEGAVSIQGTPTVGNTLTSEVVDADGTSGDITYQWFADDEEIINATQSTYVVEESLLDKVIKVQVTYTDDNGFAESNVSPATIPVTSFAVDQLGTVEIIGTSPYLTSNTLTAEVSDNNGVDEANIIYAWSADGVEVANTNSKTFTPTAYAGAIISVNATYTDNDNFPEVTVTDSLTTLVYTKVVNNAEELLDSVNTGLGDGDVVGLNENVYANMDEILLTSAVTLRSVEEQNPVITGEVCIHVADSVDGAALTNLTFKDIDTKAGSFCETEEDAVIYSEGNNFTFSQNTIDGEEAELNNSTYHWLVLKGQGAMIERNTFSGRNFSENGSVIKMASSGSDHIIQYNLFNDSSENANFDNSSLHLINAGSTTGTDAANNANFKIQYNLVENFVTGRRLMRVQTSGASIKGNTIFNANGGISIEDGGFNSITDNVIIRTTDIASSDDRPSGVLITPLGHTVSNNYIAGIRSGNKEAGGIVFTANPFSQADGGVPNSGNQAVLDGAGDLTLTVANNTVLNSQQPIVFSTEIGSRAPGDDCDDLADDTILYGLTKNAFVINFDANLIANGLGDQTDADTIASSALTQGLFYPNTLSSDHTFEYDCDLINHEESLLSNNFGFSDSYVSGDTSESWVDIRQVNGNGEFDTDGAIDQDPAGNGKEVPEFITGVSSLIETDSAGAQSIAGAKGLHYIQASQVGVGSTWNAQDE
jgi:parallel beta-helix repeat protein